MYVREDQELGIIAEAIGTVLTLKNLLGIGVKKAKFKALAESGVGAWTSQYPSDWDWKNYPSGHKPPVSLGYAKERAKKDSILLKNQIATPEDFAAWHFTEYGSKYANAGDLKWLPSRVDGSRIDKAPAQLATVPGLDLTPGYGAPISSYASAAPVAAQPKIAVASMLPMAALGVLAFALLQRNKK